MIPRKSILAGLGFALGSALGYGVLAQTGCTASDVLAALSPAYRAERALADYKAEVTRADAAEAAERLAEVHAMEDERRDVLQDAETDDLNTKHRLEDLEDRFAHSAQRWQLEDAATATERENQIARLEANVEDAGTLQTLIGAGLTAAGGTPLALILARVWGARRERRGRDEGRNQGQVEGRAEGAAAVTRTIAQAKRVHGPLAEALSTSPLRVIQEGQLGEVEMAAVKAHKNA